MRLDRQITKLIKISEVIDQEVSPNSPGICISEVWELTKEIFSLSQKFDVKSRLQRDVVHIVKGKS
jgi:hypothetical protein